MSVLKNLLKDSVIYGIGNAISKFIQILTLPIITKFILSEGEFNSWNNVNIIFSLLGIIILLGFDSTVARFLVDSNSESEKKRIFTTGIIVILANTILFYLLIQMPFISNKVVHFSKLQISNFHWLFFWLFFNIVITYIQSYFRWTLKKYKFLILSFGITILNVSSLLIYSYYAKFDALILIKLNVLTSFIIFVLSILLVINNFEFYFNKSLYKKLCIYGLPLMVIAFLGTFKNSVDRMFLDYFKINDSQVYAYNIAQRVAGVLLLLNATFDMAISPFFLNNWENKNLPFLIQKIYKLYIAIGIFVLLVVSSFSKFAIFVFAHVENQTAEKALTIFIISNFIYGLLLFVSIGIYYSKKSFLNLYAFIISLVVAILLNFILTFYFGIYGSATSLLVSNIVLLLSLKYFSDKYYPVNLKFINTLPILLISLSLVIYLPYLNIHSNMIIDGFIKLAVILLFVSILLFKYHKQLKSFFSNFNFSVSEN